MSHSPTIPRPARRSSGFTLIELMIGVAIVAILVAVALPAYRDSIRKSRRAEGFKAITAVQQAQERWRGRFSTYADNSQLTAAWAGSPPGLAIPATTASGYYGLAISSADAKTYVITATAAGSQASDTQCAVLAAQLKDGNLKFGAGAGTVDFTAAEPDPNHCWAR